MLIREAMVVVVAGGYAVVSERGKRLAGRASNWRLSTRAGPGKRVGAGGRVGCGGGCGAAGKRGQGVEAGGSQWRGLDGDGWRSVGVGVDVVSSDGAAAEATGRAGTGSLTAERRAVLHASTHGDTC